jgi:hypothetical protein
MNPRAEAFLPSLASFAVQDPDSTPDERATGESMSERVVFWYGCNAVRHGDIIHGCMELLKALGIEAVAVGGPSFCCGTSKDANLQAAQAMARRTVARFNALAADTVVSWCPSCYRHMGSFITGYNDAQFDVSNFAALLHRHRDRLAPRLTHAVGRKALLHTHFGFHEVDINPLVADLLRMVPGLELTVPEYSAPGHMCSALQSVPAAFADVVRTTNELAPQHEATDVVTVFHSCQRLLCGLEATQGYRVVNYVSLLTEAMGMSFADEYKQWKLAADEQAIGELVGANRLAKVGPEFFQRALLPELKAKPPK